MTALERVPRTSFNLTMLLSQHSSNPLEVGSSDPRNRAYHREYLSAQKGNGVQNFTSEDGCGSCSHQEVAEYHNHLAQLYNRSLPATKSRPNADELPLTVDLDESDDEPNSMDCPNDMCDLEGYEDDEDGDADAPGETDEETTIHLRPPEEREEIQLEIASLLAAVPQLSHDYKILDRLGTGTFSSVYKAIDLWYYSKWDNTPWHGHHPPSSSAYCQTVPYPNGSRVFVAVKRIYVTSNPERIRNEISIMEDCRGTRHTSQLITAFRNRDQVVVIMPYNRNEDFRDFFMDLSMAGIKAYLRCMFRALRDVHARGIIHRDVKPANFLFDPRTGIGTLCDFGLASRMDSTAPVHGSCLHTPPSREFPHGKIKSRDEYDAEHLKKMQKEARHKSLWTSDRVGYPEKDTRPHSKANRAGTRGFRAPEVLLKCGSQTGAIDVWAAGTILLFFLTRKFPLFQSSDDIEALMEIATIIGRQKMERAAILHSRTFATNVPSLSLEGVSWQEFVEKQNPELMRMPCPDSRYYPYNTHEAQSTPGRRPASTSSTHPSLSQEYDGPRLSSRSPTPTRSAPQYPTEESHKVDVENAFSLLKQLMEPESHRRITPRGALYHTFFTDPSEPEDDELFPHPSGEGVCGKHHFKDGVTEEHCVLINVDGEERVRRLVAGEGVAIGRAPCELHRRQSELDD